MVSGLGFTTSCVTEETTASMYPNLLSPIGDCKVTSPLGEVHGRLGVRNGGSSHSVKARI